ncbi:MAG TPA: hypothetical protein VKP69_22880 [Isosphaeraceae bacterium]|nr:hypothetical protein [Isosphaeraceae bacterium]
MGSPRTGAPRRRNGRRWVLRAGLAVGWIVPSAGCQVEYAGMTLPSGKYMHDDVQYFPPGPDFPWANTQAATQRARMQAMGLEPPLGATGPLTVPPAAGAIPPVQNRMGRPTDVNASPLSVEPPPIGGGAGVPVGPQPGLPGVPPPPPPGVPAPAPPGSIPAPVPEAGAGGPATPAGPDTPPR